MYFILSNLLHDFPNDKYKFFFLIKKKNMWKLRVNPTQPACNLIDINPFLTRLNDPFLSHSLFDP